MITHKLIKFSLFLTIALGLANSCKAAEQSSTEVAQIEQKKEAEEIIHVEGELRLINDNVTTVQKIKDQGFFPSDAATMEEFYGASNKDVLIGTDYYSQECEDWSRRIHPKFSKNRLRNEWLPACTPIAYKAIDSSKLAEIILDASLLYKPLNSIVAEYCGITFDTASKVALMDLTHGDVIQVRLPIRNINVQAQLKCTKRYTAPFHIALAYGLVKKHEVELDEAVRTKLEQRWAEYDKKQKEEAELRRKKIDEEMGISAPAHNEENACIVS